MVKLDDHLSRRSADVTVDPVKRYRTTGVLSHGKGFFWRTDISGSETSYRAFTRLRTNDFVFSKLFGWEGALGVVPEVFDGGLVSSEFPVFDVGNEVLDPSYLGFVVRRPDFYRALATSGMGNRRQRVNPGTVLDSEIPLPPIDEQRRIATWLSSIGTMGRDEISDPIVPERDSDVFDRAIELGIEQLTEGWERQRIGEVAELGPRVSIDPALASFVPMNAVSESGQVVSSTEFGAARSASGYSRFASGDILYAKITPCMENGKVALVGPAIDVGLGSSEFFVLRAHQVDPRWLHVWLRRRAFRAQAKQAFTGTAGQQRVPAAFLSAAPIPVPPDERRLCFALERVSALQDAQSVFRAGLHRRKRLRDSVLPSALNQVFNS